jgi:hypothetical protein
VSTAPVLVVTTANSLAAFGLEPRRYLQVVRDLRVPLLPALAKTKLRAVRASDLLAALETVNSDPAAPPVEETKAERYARIAGLR